MSSGISWSIRSVWSFWQLFTPLLIKTGMAQNWSKRRWLMRSPGFARFGLTPLMQEHWGNGAKFTPA